MSNVLIGIGAVILVMVVLGTGCTSLRKDTSTTLAQTEAQARQMAAQNEASADVLKAAIAKNQQILADRLANVQDKGLSHTVSMDFHERKVDGEIYEGADGKPLPIRMNMTAKWSSMHEMAGGFEAFDMKINEGLAQAEGGSAPGFTGISLNITGASGGHLSGEYERERGIGRAGEKTASGAAVAKAIEVDWAGRVQFLENGVVEVIRAGGEVATGVLVSISPYGAAEGLVRVVMERNGKEESIVVPKPAVNIP